MPNLVKRIAMRPRLLRRYLTFGTSGTLADASTAAGKGECPKLVRRGARLGQLHPHFSISTYRNGRARSAAGLGLPPPRWPLGNCVHDPDAAQLVFHERVASRLPNGPTRHLGVPTPRWP